MKRDGLFVHRNFVWLSTGTAISSLGDQVGWLALLWLVAVQYSSSAKLGWTVLCYELPSVSAAMVAGVLMDRYSRRRLMVADNVVRGAVFLLVPILCWRHALPFWLLCTAMGVAGLLSPLTTIGAMAMVPQVVPADELSAANAWEETIWQGATLLGPLVGGLLIHRCGPAWAILLDGLSFFACAACLLCMSTGSHIARRSAGGWAVRTAMRDWFTGVRALLALPVVLAITVIALMLNAVYGQLDVALPWLVHRDLSLGASSLGLLWTAYGLGGVMGTAVFAAVRVGNQQGLWMSVMVIGMGLSLLPLIWVHGVSESLGLLWCAGFCFGPYAPLARTIVQKHVPDGLRGRIFGIRTALMGLGVPAGAFLAGMALHAFRADVWVGVVGSVVLVVGLGMLVSRWWRKDRWEAGRP
ncbi:MFS transporter [Alicyclobacillus contaminans]|uniref:MFS transporter n=1 Tax=Alicyclobacillus contaminans TaxID=392016 RepID=UPI0004095AB5|nr:MFS transporter [Alicyclobacillus contaminans]GMA52423.1 MFS transporter [Alicyclobacillus contaminans]